MIVLNKNVYKTFVFALLSLILSGCSISKENFDCKYGKGVGCRSITEVNGMVNQGVLGSQSKASQTPLIKNPIKSSLTQDVISSDSTVVQRITEEHLRVWVAPFQDERGQFHEGSVIHTVLRPGFWQVQEGF